MAVYFVTSGINRWPGLGLSAAITLSVLPLLIGFILDLMFGDPQGFPHPVRLIGWMIKHSEIFLRRIFPPTAPAQRKAGLILAIGIPLSILIMSLVLLAAAYWANPWLGFLIECILSWQILATCCLKQETSKVFHALNDRDLPQARRNLAWLVGRDTESLPETGVIKGTVETIAENTTDGVISPLFYLAIGGVPLALAYKAINTLDSMIGYKNEKYLDFGRYSAKLDDAANYVPARLAALMMFLGSSLLGYPARQTWATYRRDRHNHASPNSAQTEAVCAGSLGIQLGGNNYYFGKLVVKPTIGDSCREPAAQDIKTAQMLLYVTAMIGLLSFLPLRVISVLCVSALGG